MRDFMTACDYCLSDCSDGSRSFDDEDCGPSRECFHVDLGGPGEGNHLGIPENGDPPRPAPHVDILRELVVVPFPTCNAPNFAVDFFFLFFTRQNSGVTFSLSFSPR
jgi:hypothetical protein